MFSTTFFKTLWNISVKLIFVEEEQRKEEKFDEYLRTMWEWVLKNVQMQKKWKKEVLITPTLCISRESWKSGFSAAREILNSISNWKRVNLFHIDKYSKLAKL